MRFIAIIASFFFAIPAFGQANCFKECFSNWERAKSNTIAPSTDVMVQISQRIMQDLVGCKAPEFDVITIGGQRLRLSALRGKVVVLNFWFIGCAPCIAELPALNRLVEDYKGKDVVFVAFGRDSDLDIREFLEKKEFKYDVVSSDYDFARTYCILNGWPTSMVLDKQGVLRKVFTGGFVNEQALTHAYHEIKPTVDEILLRN